MQYEYIHRYALSSRFIVGKNVLSIGLGEGNGSRILAKVAASVVGIEYDRDTVERAKRTHSSIDNLSFVQGSCDAIPLGDQSIDVVVSFENYEKYDEMLGEIKRILRPNGLLFWSILNTSALSSSKALDYDDLIQSFRRCFSNVTAYAQRSNVASFIFPFDVDHHEGMLRYVSAFERKDLSNNVLDAAVYFFITCSDDTLPHPDRVTSVHSDLSTSQDGYAWYTLLGHLAQLYTDLDASRRTIAVMQGSKFWKLREAWFGVRDRRAWRAAVAPPLLKILRPLTLNHRATRYPIPATKFLMAAVVSPLQKILWGLTYNLGADVATRFSTPGVTFMNLGYIGGADEPRPALEAIDELNRLPIQLYHHVGTLVDLAGREVLEVGSGRGGGASYVKRYLGPASVVGVDLADQAVEFCRRTHRLEGLRFVQGDAERLPFDDQQFDVVINVESSHCYPAVDAFFREVKRVLRPGGHFLYTDLVLLDRLPEWRKMLNQAGLEIVQERDITSNVLASLDSNSDQRVASVQMIAPVVGLDIAREWAILPGSKLPEGMRAGTLCYVSMALRTGQPAVTARA